MVNRPVAMSEPRPNPHLNLDEISGDCLDCGATRAERDDNLAPTCEKVTGTNRLTFFVVRREMRRREHELAGLRGDLRRAERAVVYTEDQIKEKEAELLEVSASLKLLSET